MLTLPMTGDADGVGDGVGDTTAACARIKIKPNASKALSLFGAQVRAPPRAATENLHTCNSWSKAGNTKYASYVETS